MHIPVPLGALPVTGFVRQRQLIPAIFPFSSATLWRKVKAGTFPQPVKLGPRITAWRVEDIREFINNAWLPSQRRTSATNKSQP